MTDFKPESYEPLALEAKWLKKWENKKENSTSIKNTFSLILPPPNVTGSLHMGHAVTLFVQDYIVRWNKMNGKNVLWIPGTDHAGLATEVVVSKKLKAEKGLAKTDVGREKFTEMIWDWKNKHENNIVNQLKLMGGDLNWDRKYFTLDDNLVYAVNHAFITLHDRGLIYRAKKMINWCPALKSTISDIEVDFVEFTRKNKLKVPTYDSEIEFGVIYHFKYPLTDGSHLEVATTRPETILGDTAIAINPSDVRFNHLVHLKAINPLTQNKIPIILDSFVDKNFGTGVVKVTPAHDITDYEVSQRHGLELIQIFDLDCKVLPGFGEFTGLKRFDARYAIIKKLKELNLYLDKKDNPMSLPICSRTGDVIESMLMEQWFVKMDYMAKRAIDVVKLGELKLFPEYHSKVWYHWLENIKPWAISRQIWWGHQIPVWFVCSKNSTNIKSDSKYITAQNETEAREKAEKLGLLTEDSILFRDPDCLDTWFSSALLPFSINGWPNNLDKNSFPLSLMETGYDILFFWVARMVMMSLELTGQLPFDKVILHQLVRDSHGQKMAKAKGNVIDPIDIIRGSKLNALEEQIKINTNLSDSDREIALKEKRKFFPKGIPECGTDGLRMGLCSYANLGADINLDINRIITYRHFCNKIWNSVMFAVGIYSRMGKRNGLGSDDVSEKIEITEITEITKITEINLSVNLWIISKLHGCIKKMTEAFETYQFDKIIGSFYDFWMHSFCDVYLEAIKPIFKSSNLSDQNETKYILTSCLDQGLRLICPIAPFVTEELYQKLFDRHQFLANGGDYSSIHSTSYPKYNENLIDSNLENEIELHLEMVKKIRAMKGIYLHNPNQFANVMIMPIGTVTIFDWNLIETLAKIHPVKITTDPDYFSNIMAEEIFNYKISITE